MEKTKHYTFTFPVREFAWCYSAKAFEESMRAVCCGRKITAIYVGSKDYGSPLRVTDTYVNYYNFSSILIRLNDCWLDLHVIACGLFRWRTFKLDEVAVASTRFATSVFDCKQDEWCEFGDAYRAFRLEYLNSNIENAAVDSVAYWPFDMPDFDETKLGDPIELPEALHLSLANGNTLSFVGWDDDFIIKLVGGEGKWKKIRCKEYETASLRARQINDLIFQNVKPLWTLRRLDGTVGRKTVSISYALTLRKSEVPLAERISHFFTLLGENLSRGERLETASRCFTVCGDGYEISYCVEAYKKSADRIGYIEDGKVCLDLIRRMPCDLAVKRCRLLEKRDLSEMYRRMRDEGMIYYHPNPADRFVACVNRFKGRLARKG